MDILPLAVEASEESLLKSLDDGTAFPGADRDLVDRADRGDLKGLIGRSSVKYPVPFRLFATSGQPNPCYLNPVSKVNRPWGLDCLTAMGAMTRLEG